MRTISKFVFFIFLTWREGSAWEADQQKHARFKRIVGGREAARPPLDDPIAYIFKEDHFAKVYGSRQGLHPHSYYTFAGLRYAQPPVGKYRFQRPKRVKMEGDVMGIKYAAPCVQPNPDYPSQMIGSEDCLFLNVHTPRLPGSGASLPVIFWIHGGGYRRGSAAQYGGGYLTRRDVVVVTVQYRLGTFGFLSTNDKDLPGNVAMFDLATAAEWVKDYIEFFGGDPANIVPMGQGSGASSAVFMGLSNVTQGRTRGMIAMSGSPLSPFAIDDKPQERSKRLAEKNGCPTTSTIEMVKCLRELSAEKLVAAETELENEEISEKGVQSLGIVLTPAPVVEQTNDKRFLPSYLEEEPRIALDMNHIPKIPLLTGVTKHETAGAVSGRLKINISEQLKQFPNFIKEVLLPNLVESNKRRFYAATSLLKNPLQIFEGKYFAKVQKTLQDEFNQIIEATSDALFNFPAYLISNAWSKQNIPTFFYSFDHIGKLKGVEKLLKGSLLVKQEESTDEEQTAVSHGADLPYLFDLRSLDGTPFAFQNESTPLEPEDEKVRNNLLDLIASFAKNSNELSVDSSGKTTTFPNFISILPESTLGEHFRECQMNLWSGIQVAKPCSPLTAIIKGIDKLFSNITTSTKKKKPDLPKLPRLSDLVKPKP
ncbi:hypothetical protein RUM44_003917 [Polyplax serrata]|uniref:Carboxylesterase type B domain-containing protein n=1 Tax=Polyplax serrata TaxID=468196 RepID=A0ABR1B231_POLSC